MDCRYLDDVYELLLLGLLRSKEAAEVHAHVERGCPYCLHHLGKAAQSVYFLLSNAKPRKPAPAVKAKMLQRLHGK